MHNPTLLLFLEHAAYQLRVNSLRMTTQAKSGHPSSCLSAADIVAVLFLYAMQYDPHNPANPNNDRFILSKGHAAPLLYAAWKEVGVLSIDDLMTYRQFSSVFEGHPTSRFSRTEAATGSLGIGLSVGAGMALSAKRTEHNYFTYVLLGDGEVTEGSIWEAAALADHYQLNNLIGMLDCNRLAQSDESLHNHHVDRYAKKFEAFGWHTIIIDGHDIPAIVHALDQARKQQDRPTMIVAKTFKGYGVSSLQDKEGVHGKPLADAAALPQALTELAQKFSRAAAYDNSYIWKPRTPLTATSTVRSTASIQVPNPDYTLGANMATRESYGHALCALGKVNDAIVSLDGDVKNSTYAELFEQQYPNRFVQCYIAEQNMVSMAVGMAQQGHIPFVSTFGAFFTRAHDQIRMAAIGTTPLRLVGSHAGISIGQDGPSQMALEDIAMMRALPDSIVLYPCDAVSTYKLVELMANYNDGVSYLRTTRMATPVIYQVTDKFSIGGCTVLHRSPNDIACIIAAGVTVFQALQAYDKLHNQGIAIAVIDAYSIKPLDAHTIISVVQTGKNRVITVEDHYLQGGLGEAVTYALRDYATTITCLAVRELPRSGTPEELLAWAKIDASAIVDAIHSM